MLQNSELRVREVLNKYDPAGVIYDDNNPDEYTPEINKIVSVITDNITVDELADYIHNVFVEYFDEGIAGSKDKYQDIAKDILDSLKSKS